jgi:hypothetical protein
MDGALQPAYPPEFIKKLKRSACRRIERDPARSYRPPSFRRPRQIAAGRVKVGLPH